MLPQSDPPAIKKFPFLELSKKELPKKEISYKNSKKKFWWQVHPIIPI